MAKETIETTIDLNRQPQQRQQQQQLEVIQQQDDDLQDGLEIEVEDDTPEGDRGRKAPEKIVKSGIPDDEEIGQYTKGVQDRMKQMKWEYHEERRAKEQWSREHAAAIEFAKKLHTENEKLRKTLETGHKTMLESNKSALENEISALKQNLQNAMETGNSQQAAELQVKLAQASARAETVSQTAPIKFEEQPVANQQQQQVQQQRQQVQLSDAMQSWMTQNPWFNRNKRMTAFAFGVHDELLEKGIPPESPRYFQEIDKATREAFPNFFEAPEENENRNTNGQRSQVQSRTVQRVNRQTNGPVAKNGKVTLTQSQVAVAKRLGITPEQYAREVIRLEQDNG